MLVESNSQALPQHTLKIVRRSERSTSRRSVRGYNRYACRRSSIATPYQFIGTSWIVHWRLTLPESWLTVLLECPRACSHLIASRW